MQQLQESILPFDSNLLTSCQLIPFVSESSDDFSILNTNFKILSNDQLHFFGIYCINCDQNIIQEWERNLFKLEMQLQIFSNEDLIFEDNGIPIFPVSKIPLVRQATFIRQNGGFHIIISNKLNLEYKNLNILLSCKITLFSKSYRRNNILEEVVFIHEVFESIERTNERDYERLHELDFSLQVIAPLNISSYCKPLLFGTCNSQTGSILTVLVTNLHPHKKLSVLNVIFNLNSTQIRNVIKTNRFLDVLKLSVFFLLF